MAPLNRRGSAGSKYARDTEAKSGGKREVLVMSR
jgi:hypothetical protein